MDTNTKEYKRYLKACEKYVDAWYDAYQVAKKFGTYPSTDEDYITLEQAFFGRTRKKYQRAKRRLIKAKEKLESVEQK